MKNNVYINGRIVSGERALVSVFDRGLRYGDGVFETLKAYDGRPVFLKEHLLRLSGGMKALGIPVKALKTLRSDIRDRVLERLLKKNGLTRGVAYIRITVTRGVDVGGHLPVRGTSPTVVVVAGAVDERAIKRKGARGVRAVTIKGPGQVVPGVKSLNYLPNVLGRIEAKRQGAVEGIFVAEDGSITEGTSSNVFVVKAGVIKTPLLSAGVLPGITRSVVIELARKKRIPVKETKVLLRDLYKGDEVFITNSVSEVVPVVRVDSKKIGRGTPGGITRVVQGEYSKKLRGAFL